MQLAELYLNIYIICICTGGDMEWQRTCKLKLIKDNGMISRWNGYKKIWRVKTRENSPTNNACIRTVLLGPSSFVWSKSSQVLGFMLRKKQSRVWFMHPLWFSLEPSVWFMHLLKTFWCYNKNFSSKCSIFDMTALIRTKILSISLNL